MLTTKQSENKPHRLSGSHIPNKHKQGSEEDIDKAILIPPK